MRNYTANFDTAMKAQRRSLDASIISSDDISFDTTDIKSIKIESSCPDGKMFGFSVCQQATVELMPSAAELYIGAEINISIGTEDEKKTFPPFIITTKEKDQKTGVIKYVSEDYLAKAETISSSQLLNQGSVLDLAESAGNLLNCNVSFDTTYTANTTEVFGAGEINKNDTMSVRDIIDDIAELTGTVAIMTLDSIGTAPLLLFKNVYAGSSAFNIYKTDYYDFSTT